MESVKSFYGKRNQNRFSPDAINQIQDDDPESVDVVIRGLPTSRQDSDLEDEDDEILNTTRLPEEITGEVEVLSIRNDEIEGMTSDGEDSDVQPPSVKKQKQNAKKTKINLKWQKQHIQTKHFQILIRIKMHRQSF